MSDEVKVAEQRGAGSGEPENRHRHQLEVDRADPQQAGDGRTEQNPGGLTLLSVDVHARGLEDVARLVGPLVRLPNCEQREPDGDPDQGDERAPSPVVTHRDDVAEDEDADGLGQRVGKIVPTEDPSSTLGGIGIGEVRVVDGVVDPGPHRRDEVQEGEGPHVGRQAHQRGEDREDQEGDPGHHLATAPVGPQRQRHRPQQLGHLGHEGHRPQGGVVHVERVFRGWSR